MKVFVFLALLGFAVAPPPNKKDSEPTPATGGSDGDAPCSADGNGNAVHCCKTPLPLSDPREFFMNEEWSEDPVWFGTTFDKATNPLVGPEAYATEIPNSWIRCCATEWGENKVGSCQTSSCIANFGRKNLNCHNYGNTNNPVGGYSSKPSFAKKGGFDAGVNAFPAGSNNCPYDKRDQPICDVSYYNSINGQNCRLLDSGEAKCLGKVKCNTVGVVVPKQGHSDGLADYETGKANTGCQYSSWDEGADCFYLGASDNYKVCGGKQTEVGPVIGAPASQECFASPMDTSLFAIDFGIVNSSDPVTLPFIIDVGDEEGGSFDVTAISSDNAGEFAVNPLSKSVKIRANSEGVSFDVTFTANGPGTRTAHITVESDTAVNSPACFRVVGTRSVTCRTGNTHATGLFDGCEDGREFDPAKGDVECALSGCDDATCCKAKATNTLSIMESSNNIAHKSEPDANNCDFGSVARGESVTKTITMTVTGDMTLTGVLGRPYDNRPFHFTQPTGPTESTYLMEITFAPSLDDIKGETEFHVITKWGGDLYDLGDGHYVHSWTCKGEIPGEPVPLHNDETKVYKNDKLCFCTTTDDQEPRCACPLAGPCGPYAYTGTSTSGTEVTGSTSLPDGTTATITERYGMDVIAFTNAEGTCYRSLQRYCPCADD